MTRLILPARVLLCAVLALMTLEGLARLDDHVREGAPWLGPFDTSLLSSRDDAGLILRPNSHFSTWKINASGFRGPEPRTNTVRIVCLGSSETFGIGAGENREYPRQLEDQLNRRLGTQSVEVLNLGIPGGVFRELPARIPQIITRYHPDFVTVYPSPAQYIFPGVFAHAAMAAQERPAAPAPKPGWGSRIHNRINRWAKRVVPLRIAAALRNPWGLREFGLNDLRITGKFEDLMSQDLPPAVLSSWRNWSADHEARRLGWPIMDRVPEEAMELFRKDLRSMVQTLEAHKIPVVLATHAVRFGDSVTAEERPLLVQWRSFYPPLREDGFLDMNLRFNLVIEEIARDQGAEAVDATRAVPPGPRYFSDFVHFTDEGADKMASLFADALAPRVEEYLATHPALGNAAETKKPDSLPERAR